MTRQLKHCIVALAVSVAAACSLAAPAGAYEPRVPETFFGVSATELWALTDGNRNAARDAQLDSMKAAGVDWARVEIGWPEVEQTAPANGAHTYDWDDADRLITAMASRGIELMAAPMATPVWAKSSRASAAGCDRGAEVASSRANDYAAFVGAILERYGANGSFWAARPALPKVPLVRVEVWNEPNWSLFWCPEPDPELFATMMKKAADAVHAVDPDAQVIMGGLAAAQQTTYSGNRVRGMAVDTFLQRAIAHEPGLGTAVDAVGFHPYDVDPAMNLSLIGWLRRQLETKGFAGAEIALTEFGWRSGGLLEGVISELLRASNYHEMTSMIARTDCGISAVAAHTWQSSELDLFNPDHWYGITSPLTGLLYASGVAYRDQIALFEGRGATAAPRRTITACNAPALPDQDGDGVPDESDDFPLDPDRPSDGEEVPPAPDDLEARTHVQRAEDSFFGVNVVQLPSDFSRLRGEYEAIASARIGTARQRIRWSYIEPVAPTDPEYTSRAQWGWLDRIMVSMATEGVRLRPSFGAAPSWVAAGEFDARYAEFMTRFAARYGRGGSFWAENGSLDDERLAVREYDVWDQGNMDQDAPGGTASAAGYAATYLAARDALRAVDGDASAILTLAEIGQTGRAGPFLRAMAADSGLRGNVDGLMITVDYSRERWSIEAVVRDMRYGLIDTDNAAAPIYFSFGAPTNGPGAVTESQRAALFTEVAARAARGDCGVAGVFAHAWTTPEQDQTNAWHWFGIANKDDATLSATAEAYRDVAATYRGYGSEPAPVDVVHPCDLPAPDRDGDGTPDPVDPAPLDPTITGEEPTLPPAPSIGGGPAASPTTDRQASFTLAAAGATGFQCSLDGAPFNACDSAPTFSALGHGDHELRVRAVDHLGLVGAQSSYSWTVDIRGPDIVDLGGPGGVSTSARVEFAFTASDSPATFWCKLGGWNWESCTSPKVYSPLPNGVYEFRVVAIDTLGNFGPVELRTFEVDTSAPQEPQPPAAPTIGGGPASSPTKDRSAAFTLAAARATGFQCSLDGAAFVNCSATPSFAGLGHGNHELRARAVGELGAVGPTSTYTWAVDIQGPDIVNLQGPGVSESARVEFSFAANEPSASFSCKLGGQSWQACTSPKVYESVGNGTHDFRVVAVDALGNAGPVTLRTFTVAVAPPPPPPPAPAEPLDETAPTVALRIVRKSKSARSARALLRVSDSSAITSLECRLDREPWRICRATERLRRLSRGRHKLQVRASDSAGNTGRAAKRWRVTRR